MPMVRDLLQEHFNKEPLKGVHPDESVATGAALLGHSLDGDLNVQLTDVLPMAIGVGVPGGSLRRVFAANSSLPSKRTCIIPTHLDNQTVLFVPIFQGESAKVDENEKLGLVEVHGLPRGPTGSQIVELSLALDAECLLQVSAKLKSGEELSDVRFCSYVQSSAAVPAPVSPNVAAAAPAVKASPSGGESDSRPAKAKTGFWSWLKGLFSRN